MSKIWFSSPGGGGGGGGLPEASGDLYLLKDGTRSLTGNLAPDASGTRNVGERTVPFQSGFFNQIILVDSTTGKKFSLQVNPSGLLSTTEV